MDYIIGFLLGFFLKEIISVIKRISNWDLQNREYFGREWDFFDKD